MVEISLPRLNLRWILLVLLWTGIPLHGQDDAASQAVALMQAGKFQDAEVILRQLEKKFPNSPDIHSKLGVALAQQGQLEPATVEYRKSLALNPRQPEVAFNLGLGRVQARTFHPGDPGIQDGSQAKA